MFKKHSEELCCRQHPHTQSSRVHVINAIFTYTCHQRNLHVYMSSTQSSRVHVINAIFTYTCHQCNLHVYMSSTQSSRVHVINIIFTRTCHQCNWHTFCIRTYTRQDIISLRKSLSKYKYCSFSTANWQKQQWDHIIFKCFCVS